MVSIGISTALGESCCWCVAKGINRTLFSVYRKAAREYNEESIVDRWTAIMEAILLK